MENHQVEAFIKRQSLWSHSLGELWNQMHRHLKPQETITVCKKITKQIMTNRRARIAKVNSARICKRYHLQIRRVTHLPIHKDSKALQLINGHIRETGVLKNRDQSYPNHFHALEGIEKSQLLAERKNRINSKLLVKLKIQKLRKLKIHQLSSLHQRQLTLPLSIMLSQSFPLQRKVELPLITLTKWIKMHILQTPTCSTSDTVISSLFAMAMVTMVKMSLGYSNTGFHSKLRNIWRKL